MTLSITVATPNYICQASDRRLVRLRADGAPETYTDQAGKELWLRLEDIRVLVTYHGIGEDATGTRTQAWLLEELKKADASRSPIGEVFSELAGQASLWVGNMYRKCPRSQRRLLRHTFLAVGWHASGTPALFQVSNFEHLETGEEAQDPWLEFKSESSILKPNTSRGVIIESCGLPK